LAFEFSVLLISLLFNTLIMHILWFGLIPTKFVNIGT